MKLRVRHSLIAAVFIAVCLLAACGGEHSQDGAFSFTDSEGRKVSLVNIPTRIVALTGSFAETVLLAGGRLVGATDDMVSERGLPTMGVTLLGSNKTPNLELTLSLSPDLVILSTDIAGHEKLKPFFERARIPFAYFHVGSFDEYRYMLSCLTVVTLRADLYRKNALDVEERIAAAIDSAENCGRRVALLRTVGSGYKFKDRQTVAGKILFDLGAVNVADAYPSLVDTLSMEIVIDFDPEILLVVPMGSGGESVDAILSQIRNDPKWQSVTAVKSDELYALPKLLFHYKPNARWGDSYEYLKEVLCQ